jgi:hypothetical protein
MSDATAAPLTFEDSTCRSATTTAAATNSSRVQNNAARVLRYQLGTEDCPENLAIPNADHATAAITLAVAAISNTSCVAGTVAFPR